VVRRAGFTFIELIFAIVIVAIIVLSMPMMTLATSKATEGGITQEAIFATSAKLIQTLGFQWDENSTDNEQLIEGSTILAGVVKIPNGTASLDFNNTTCRAGLIARRCRIDDNGNEVNVSNMGNDNSNSLIRGLDDSAGTSTINTTSSEGYKNKYTIITSVGYVSDNNNSAGGGIDYNSSNPFSGNSFVFSDTNVTGPTNLRLVTVSIFKTDDLVNPITLLRSYSANIGEIKPYKRTY
jgi:prepilin-type N-terminal cleavage/methylation domain-containing protein